MTLERPSPNPTLLLFWGLIAFHLGAVWGFEFLASQDGPAHVATGVSLANIGNTELPAFARYLSATWRFGTNQFVALAVSELSAVIDPFLVEKLILSLYTVLLPVSFLYTLKAVAPRGETNFAAFLIFPFVFSRVFHLGFYNFCLGLVLFFVVLGYALRHLESPRAVNFTVLFGLLFVGYLLHPLPAAAAALMIASLAATRVVRHFRRPDPTSDAGPAGARKIPWAIGLGSAAIVGLAAYFMADLALAIGLEMPALKDPITRFGRLVPISSLLTFGIFDFALGVALNGVLIVVGSSILWRKISTRQFENKDHLFFSSIALFLGYIIAPKTFFIPDRFQLFVYFSAILWLGSSPLSAKWRRVATPVCVAVAVAFLGLRIPIYSDLDDKTREVVSTADRIEPGSTLYAVKLDLPKPTIVNNLSRAIGKLRSASGALDSGITAIDFQRIDVLFHAEGYVSARADLVDLSNFQTRYWFFPLRIIERLDPDPYLLAKLPHQNSSVGPARGFAAYERETGGRIDYVLVNREFLGPLATLEDGRAILKELNERYMLIHTSEPRGLVELYRRR